MTHELKKRDLVGWCNIKISNKNMKCGAKKKQILYWMRWVREFDEINDYCLSQRCNNYLVTIRVMRHIIQTLLGQMVYSISENV